MGLSPLWAVGIVLCILTPDTCSSAVRRQASLDEARVRENASGDSAHAVDFGAVEFLRESWRNRVAAVSSVEITISVKMTCPKGALKYQWDSNHSSSTPLPAVDTTTEQTIVIGLDRTRHRLHCEGTQIDASSGHVVAGTTTYVQNTNAIKSLAYPDVALSSRPIGRYLNNTMHRSTTILAPLIWFYRPDDSTQPGPGREGAKVIVGPPDETDLLMVFDSSEQRRWGVDVGAHDAVMRYWEFDDTETLRTDIAITYVPDAVTALRPDNWRVSWHWAGNTPGFHYDVQVVDVQLNPIFGEDYFDLEFPVASMVVDDRAFPPKRFIVADDHTMTPIGPHLPVASPMARRDNSRALWIIVAANAFVVCSLVLYLKYKGKHKST